MKQALKAAFPLTIPIMLGYLSIGVAFGLLFQNAGFNFMWTFFMSFLVYAGSMQFIAVSMITSGLSLIQTALMTLLVNIRHMFYGLSFLESFQQMGKAKGYMIFSLTDETYSLLCSVPAPEGVDSRKFLFSVSLLNHCYWVAGSVAGSLLGSFITFNTTGMDFAMTALFIVIFLDQWKAYKTHIPALLGIFASIAVLLLAGADNMVLPAMLLISALLLVFRRPVEKKIETEDQPL